MENCKNYIGVKVLQAGPMTRGEYNKYRGWTIPENENPADPGYLVKYSDSYESWSPKDVFESAYFEMGDDPTRITQDMIERFMGNKIRVKRLDPKTTLVGIEMVNGFKQYETSSCVDPLNYDETIGKDICLKRIADTTWLCLGFVLQWAKRGLTKETREENYDW